MLRGAGYLEQEPKLSEDKNVLENIEEAVADTRNLLNRYTELSVQCSDESLDPEQKEKLMNEMFAPHFPAR